MNADANANGHPNPSPNEDGNSNVNEDNLNSNKTTCSTSNEQTNPTPNEKTDSQTSIINAEKKSNANEKPSNTNNMKPNDKEENNETNDSAEPNYNVNKKPDGKPEAGKAKTCNNPYKKNTTIISHNYNPSPIQSLKLRRTDALSLTIQIQPEQCADGAMQNIIVSSRIMTNSDINYVTTPTSNVSYSTTTSPSPSSSPPQLPAIFPSKLTPRPNDNNLTYNRRKTIPTLFTTSVKDFIKIRQIEPNGSEMETFYAFSVDAKGERYTSFFPLNANYPEKDIVKFKGAEFIPQLSIWCVPPLRDVTDFNVWITAAARNIMSEYSFTPDQTRFRNSPLVSTSYAIAPALPPPPDRSSTGLAKVPTKPTSTTDKEYNFNSDIFNELDTLTSEQMDKLESERKSLLFIQNQYHKCPKCKAPIDVSEATALKVRCGNKDCNHSFCRECMDPWVGIHGARTGGLQRCNRVAKLPKSPSNYMTDKPAVTPEAPKKTTTLNKKYGDTATNNSSKQRYEMKSTQQTGKKKARDYDDDEEDDYKDNGSSDGDDTYENDSWCKKDDHSNSGDSYRPPSDNDNETGDEDDEDELVDTEDERSSKDTRTGINDIANDDDDNDDDDDDDDDGYICKNNKTHEKEESSLSRFSDDFDTDDYNTSSDDGSSVVQYMGTRKSATKRKNHYDNDDSDVEIIGVIKAEKKVQVKSNSKPSRHRHLKTVKVTKKKRNNFTGNKFKIKRRKLGENAKQSKMRYNYNSHAKKKKQRNENNNNKTKHN